ncbi:P1 family peptidase [Ahrensia marina]|uniref:Aminopeptidase n=1 Tax=Ahrensia marina TaxID=1514904 RepID=A0A0M9GL83_9HYPH|nr:P1 family peptidase [Ahrensia marina]KPB00046.1 aminopeptidase [Ahrensia marina]
MDAGIPTKPRARAIGLTFCGETGPYNAITDVPGVLVGYETLSSYVDPALQTGALPVLTGVTAILPRGFDKTPRPVWAGQFSLNGNGEMTGTHWVKDGGYLVGPVMITNSHSVGPVHDGATRWMVEHYADSWQHNHLWAMPVVAETYDGVLNDINGFHVTKDHALSAIKSAKSGTIEEGNVGGGTGMICYEYKGGTGTSSRTFAIDGGNFTLGVLVQANHGIRPWLTVSGVRLGETMCADRIPGFKNERGSIVCIIATDLPLSPLQLEKLSRRATIGISKSGSPGGNNSGDIFLAFSTANEAELPQFSGPWRTFISLNDEFLDQVYLSAVEAIEEAVLNAMLAANDVPTARPTGSVCKSIDGKELLDNLNFSC